MKFVICLLAIIAYFYIKKLFFLTSFGKNIKHKKETRNRLERISQRHLKDIKLDERISRDVHDKTGFDLSGAKLMVYIDYSTDQLASEEAYYLFDDISPYQQQAENLNFDFGEEFYIQNMLGLIAGLISKSKKNKRVSILNSRNSSCFNKLTRDETDGINLNRYYLSGRGGDKFHQGDVSISILPDLSMIIVSNFHF